MCQVLRISTVHKMNMAFVFMKFSYVSSVNYKLALARSICQPLNINKGIGHLPPWRLNPVLLKQHKGVQCGVRHSVLQEIWWDRSLDGWMFLGTDFMTSILASPHI